MNLSRPDPVIAGIIAEYNPFHDGHRYHLQQTRRLLQPDVLVVIVSGFYSSRGLPSLLLPEEKARLAIAHGADLVLELPAFLAMQSADYFAKAAMESLKACGVNTICFGSETNDLSRLQAMSQAYDRLLSSPDSIERSASLAASAAGKLEALQPNDILGLQYLRQADRLGMKAVSIQRHPGFRSATKSRQDFFEGIHHEGDELYDDRQRWQSYYPYLRMKLLLDRKEELADSPLVTEGIESRLIRAARDSDSWNSFLQQSISKTYTKARIQRTCMQILLGLTKEETEAHREFSACKVLGMNDTGAKWLKTRMDQVPVWTRMRDLPPFWKREDLHARTLYSLISNKPLIPWKVLRIKGSHQNPEEERTDSIHMEFTETAQKPVLAKLSFSDPKQDLPHPGHEAGFTDPVRKEKE